MDIKKLIAIACLSLTLVGGVAAQKSRRKTSVPSVSAKPAAPEPTPAPVSAKEPAAPKAPVPLAIVNDQTITTADIDRSVREQVENLDERIADARRQVLELQINTALLELESKKRKLTPQQLYNLEVSKRVADPNDAEIQKFLEDNRDQIKEGDAATVRSQTIALLRATREAKISEEFVRRLRGSYLVAMVLDPNTPNLVPSAVLATVAGKPITADAIIERLKPTIYKLRLDAYEMQKEAAERTINDLLLIAEANRRNVPPEEIVRTEVSEKANAPTEAEVAKFYAENKSRITGDLDSVRSQVRTTCRNRSASG